MTAKEEPMHSLVLVLVLGLRLGLELGLVLGLGLGGEIGDCRGGQVTHGQVRVMVRVRVMVPKP